MHSTGPRIAMGCNKTVTLSGYLHHPTGLTGLTTRECFLFLVSQGAIAQLALANHKFKCCNSHDVACRTICTPGDLSINESRPGIRQDTWTCPMGRATDLRLHFASFITVLPNSA